MTDARIGRNNASTFKQSLQRKASARTCPICKGEVTASTDTFPFCSKRCRLVDLGQWFSESYAISREIEPEDDV